MKYSRWRIGLRTKLSITMLGLLLIPFIIIKQLNKTEAFLWQQAQRNMQHQLRQLVFSFSERPSRLDTLENIVLSIGPNGHSVYLKALADYFQVDGSFSDWQNEEHQRVLFEQDGSELRLAKSNRLTILNLQVAGVGVGGNDHIKIFIESDKTSASSSIEKPSSAIPKSISARNSSPAPLSANRTIEQASFGKIGVGGEVLEQFDEAWNLYLKPGGIIEVLFRTDRIVNKKPVFTKDSRIKGQWQSANGQIFMELSFPSILLTESIKLAIRRSETGADSIYPIQVWSPVLRLIDTAKDIEHWTHAVPLPSGSELQIHTKAGKSLHQRLKIDMEESGLSNRWLKKLLQARTDQRDSYSIETMINNYDNRAFSGVTTSPDSKTSMMLNGVIAIKNGSGDNILGYLSLQQSLESFELVQQKWLSSWLGSMFWVLCLIAFLLLGYATLLILRVRRLASSLKQSVNDKGIVIKTVDIDNASDEIGELSVNIADVVEKLGVQQEYLRRLSSKLSHELRTPIAVVRGALENLAYEISDQENDSLKRAEHGISRLSLILTRMSEATRIEESLTKSAKQVVSLHQLLESYISAISSSHYCVKFELVNDTDEHSWIAGAPELLMQACDKLISNAIDFCDSRYPIRITVSSRNKKVYLRILNVGPHIEGTTERLFQPLVSERDASTRKSLETSPISSKQAKAEQTHLGLGLYVVKIISDYHQAQIRVENTHYTTNEGELSAVEFALIFDKSQ